MGQLRYGVVAVLMTVACTSSEPELFEPEQNHPGAGLSVWGSNDLSCESTADSSATAELLTPCRPWGMLASVAPAL